MLHVGPGTGTLPTQAEGACLGGVVWDHTWALEAEDREGVSGGCGRWLIIYCACSLFATFFSSTESKFFPRLACIISPELTQLCTVICLLF